MSPARERGVTLALAQVALGPEPPRNLTACLRAIRAAAAGGADVVAFAELSHLPFFPRTSGEAPSGWAETVPGPTTERLAELSRELGIVIVFNLFERDGGRTFDSTPVIDADGTLLGVTRMVHVADFEGFRETHHYAPGDRGAPVYDTRVGRIGVAICYDRHFPEYMRLLRLGGAELVVVPQAGLAGEWAGDMHEAEIRVAAFQNGYHVALVNRVGTDGTAPDAQTFAGESFAVDPHGRVLARAASGRDDLVLVSCDLSANDAAPATRWFLPDRRPECYLGLAATESKE